MSIFKDVKLAWKGEIYTIKADSIMRLLAKLESEISLSDLSCANGKPPLAKISIAYALALSHAGASVTDEQVYAEMFGDGDVSAATMSGAITGLMFLMTPPDSYQPHISENNEGK